MSAVADFSLADLGVSPCPPPSGGVHSWLFAAACACRDAVLSPDDAERLIRAAMTRPPSPQNEVESAVRAAYASEPGDRAERFPERDLGAIADVVLSSQGGRATEWPYPGNVSVGDVLSALFHPGELLCTGKALQYPDVTPFDPANDYGEAQFIVPSPMAKVWGRTKDGRLSKRCLETVGPRRWLVIECDFTPEDVEAACGTSSLEVCRAVLGALSEYRPCVLAVHSGGKSLHGWFPVVPGESEDPGSDLWNFFAYAVRLGADPKTWCPVQWVRMPGGLRRHENGRADCRQAVKHFDRQTAEEFRG